MRSRARSSASPEQVKERPDETEDLIQIYVPNQQVPHTEAYLLVRTGGEAEAHTPDIRRAIARRGQTARRRHGRHARRHRAASDRAPPFPRNTRDDVRGARPRAGDGGGVWRARLSVQQRVREFGVRIALGASTRQVLGLVLGGAARVVGVGAVIGLIAAAILSRSISAFLFGVEPLDPLTFGSVAIVLALTAALASAAPALRAARVDPVVAFRNE
jgi:putative ABC transport system permease protein